MKTVSEAYNRVIVSDVINDTIRGSIDGETFDMNDLVSLKISQKGTSGNDLQIGGVFSQQMTLEMFYDETADGDYKKYNGSMIGLSYHIKLPTTEEYEPCALNLFTVTQAERLSQTVILTAYDMMINLEKRYDGWDDISHDLYDWYTKICHDCQVTAGMTENEFKALANISSVGAVNIKPGGVFATYRDIAHHIAVLIGGYAFIRGSSLYFAEYKNRSPVLTIPVNLIDDGDKFSDYSVRFTTVTAQHDNTLISATLDNANGREYSLGELPLLEDFGGDGVYQTVVNNILTNLSTIEYTPFELKWTGNPALECGDFVAIEGTDIISPVTSIDWAFDEMETLKAVGSEQDIVQNATSSAGSTTSKEINQVKQTIKETALKHLLDGSSNGSLRSDTSAKETDDYKLPYDAIALGQNNKSKGMHCAAISGGDNEIYSVCRYSAIYAGAYNKLIKSSHSIINGGYFNSIESGGSYNSITGGINNKITGSGCNAISGGEYNKITKENNGYASFIGGGSFNELSCEYASILGGQYNKLIKSSYSCILGGYDNAIQGGSKNVILGGEYNEVDSSSDSFISGSSNNVTNSGRVVCLGQANTITDSSQSICFGEYHNIENCSHTAVFNKGNKPKDDNQFICGTYNEPNPDALFQIGNGTGDSNRSNAFEVLKDGTVIINEKMLQQTPLFVNSVEECTDITKVYVLPDGYIYSYLKTEKEVANYTNQLIIATDNNDNLYNNGQGFKSGYRLNSSGAETSQDGMFVTGFIPCELGDVIRFKDIQFTAKGNYASQTYFTIYDKNKNVLVSKVIGYLSSDNDAVVYENNDLDVRNIIQINTANAVSTTDSSVDWRNENMAYFRISCTEITSDSIITVNESITTNIETVYAWGNTGLAFVPADYEDRIIEAETNIEELNQRVKVIESIDLDSVPDYVKLEAEEVVNKVISAQGNNTFTFAAISDLHYGNGNYADGVTHTCQALKYIDSQIKLDAVAVLGDYTDGYPTSDVDNAINDFKSINKLLNELRFAPNLRLQGNHDYYADNFSVTHRMIQAYSDDVVWGSKIDGYYYKDFDDYKLRVICVNTVEVGNDLVRCSTEQYNWFINSLDLSAKENATDWQILVLSHHPLDWFVESEYIFCHILDAYDKGISWSNETISCDFTGKNSAKLIGNIHGHIHNFKTDYIYFGNVNSGSQTSVLRISTPEACIGRENQYEGAYKDEISYPKIKDSAEDTAFCVYCIDFDSNTIEAICYGAGTDRTIKY